ncbi:MAG: PAS domain-containing protein [Desulforegulaceae bacterium]|nr:PAS domain-containing protein [Desulforegulaceae bacterium]
MCDKESSHERLQEYQKKIKELEKEIKFLKSENIRFEAILADLETGLSMVNKDFTITWANNKTYEILSETDPVGKKCHKVFSLSETPCSTCPVQASFKTGEPERIEKYNLPQKKWYSIFSLPVKNLKGEVDSVLEAVTDITEYKQAEIKALEEKKLLNQIMETSPAGIFVLDKNGFFIRANSRAEEIAGLERKEIYKRSYNDLKWKIKKIDGTDYPKEELPFNLVKKNKKPVFGIEHSIVRPDGKKVILSVNAAPIFDKNGLLEFIVSFIEDISGLKKAYSELRHILEATTDGIWTWDFLSGELFFSSKYYTMLGYEDNEFAPGYENWINLIHPEDRESAIKTSEEYLKNKPENYENEFRLKTKTGEYKWIKARVKVTEWDGNCNPVYMIGNHEDITQRKRSEILLEESKKRLSLALFGGGLGVWDWNFETGEYFFDEHWASMKGYSPCDLVPNLETWKNLIHPEDFPGVIDRLNSHLKGITEFYEAEYRMKRKDGTWVWILSKGKVFEKDKAGNPLRDCGTHHDVTEKKEYEIKQAKLEKRLQHLYKMEALGALAGGIAHDFNNILVPIVGLSEMLMEDFPEESDQYSYSREIFKSGMRGSELVKQILAFSRQSESEIIPVKFQSIINDTVKLARATIPSSIEIKTSIDKKCGYINGNPTQLHQIVMNLLVNAYHAIESGNGTISLGLVQRYLDGDNLPGVSPAPGEYAVFTVEDTGKGISSDIMDKIFDPYFTTKGNDKGTGLGLSVIQGIVDEFKGCINVNSETGKGSVFTVYLPVVQKDVNIKNESGEDPEPEPKGTENILFIDDESPITNISKATLERLGYKVTAFNNSMEALDLFKKNPQKFDLIITDMNMPEMTGIELAGKVNLIKPGFPLIICTGFSERIDPEKSFQLGIKGFLKKPVVKSEIAKEIRRVLDNSKSS